MRIDRQVDNAQCMLEVEMQRSDSVYLQEKTDLRKGDWKALGFEFTECYHNASHDEDRQSEELKLRMKNFQTKQPPTQHHGFVPGWTGHS